MLTSRAWASGLAPLLLVACSTSSSNISGQIADLRAQHEAEKVRLAEIRREIATAEIEAEQAQERAAHEACRATIAGIHADESLMRARCLAQVAEHEGCLARVEASRGKSSLTGCLLGIGAAALTGGSAAPIALAGCGLGTLAGPDQSSCGDRPTCSDDLDLVRSQVLSARLMASMPRCGTSLGLSVRTSTVVVEGLPEIREIVQGGTAHYLGARPGDQLWTVGGERIAESADLERILGRFAPGDPIEVLVVRNGSLLSLTGRARTAAAGPRAFGQARDAADPRVRLGVQYSPGPRTQVSNGLRVMALVPGGPGERAGLGLADVVWAVDGQLVAREDDLLEALNALSPGKAVTLRAQRGELQLTLTATTTFDRRELQP